MKNIQKFIQFLSEEVRIDKMDPESVELIKKNLITRLVEYKNSILDNIIYDFSTNKVEYKEYNDINVNTIMSELNTDFTPEVIQDLIIDTLENNLILHWQQLTH